MEWKPDALKELEKVPEHVRSMAKMGIETAVEKKGKKVVSIEDVNEAAMQFRAIMGKEEKRHPNSLSWSWRRKWVRVSGGKSSYRKESEGPEQADCDALKPIRP